MERVEEVKCEVLCVGEGVMRQAVGELKRWVGVAFGRWWFSVFRFWGMGVCGDGF